MWRFEGSARAVHVSRIKRQSFKDPSEKGIRSREHLDVEEQHPASWYSFWNDTSQLVNPKPEIPEIQSWKDRLGRKLASPFRPPNVSNEFERFPSDHLSRLNLQSYFHPACNLHFPDPMWYYDFAEIVKLYYHREKKRKIADSRCLNDILRNRKISRIILREISRY